jgi:putative SOS response-associated peptidase YedK
MHRQTQTVTIRTRRQSAELVCGRFNVEADPLSRLLLELVGLPHPGPDNHNAAPTETLVVLRLDGDGRPELVPMRWWLTPRWAKEASTRYSMFNAKSETVHSSPAFREPFRRHRCLVPACGFYEWLRRGGRKLPYYIHPAGAPGLLLAGIWDRWHDPERDTVLESFAILTTDSASGLEFVHHRQPVIIAPAEARRWLDPTVPREALAPLLAPVVPVALEAVPVSSYVNDARHKDRRCLQPVGAPRAVPAGP